MSFVSIRCRKEKEYLEREMIFKISDIGNICITRSGCSFVSLGEKFYSIIDPGDLITFLDESSTYSFENNNTGFKEIKYSQS